MAGCPRLLSPPVPISENIAREAGVELMEKPVDLPLLLKRIGALLSKPQGDAPALSRLRHSLYEAH